jgi:hypothetical protein
MSLKAFQTEPAIKVNVIQTEERKSPWKRAELSEVGSDIRFVQVWRHGGCYRAAHPLIEISENDTRALQVLIEDNALLKKLASLFPLLEESCAEMNVEHVQRIVVEANIGAQAPAAFPPSGTDVIVLMSLYRESRQHDIAVAASLVPAILAERKVEPQFPCDESRLVLFARTAFNTDNFLQRNDIGTQFTQDFDDSIGTDLSINATTFVYVVGDDAKGRLKLCHEKQPAG